MLCDKMLPSQTEFAFSPTFQEHSMAFGGGQHDVGGVLEGVWWAGTD